MQSQSVYRPSRLRFLPGECRSILKEATNVPFKSPGTRYSKTSAHLIISFRTSAVGMPSLKKLPAGCKRREEMSNIVLLVNTDLLSIYNFVHYFDHCS
jgi:hypothetical protein